MPKESIYQIGRFDKCFCGIIIYLLKFFGGISAMEYMPKHVERARKRYVKSVQRNILRQKRREELLRKNDAMVKKAHDRYDERLDKVRKHVDERLVTNRENIRKKYVKGDARKEERLNRRIAQTDALIAKRRERRNKAVERHRSHIGKERVKYQSRWERIYRAIKGRYLERLNLIEAGKRGILLLRQFRALVIAGLILVSVVATAFVIIRISVARRKHRQDEKLFAEVFEMVPYLENGEDVEEDQLLWKVLYRHFDGNETAVIGVMCNLKAESDFRANNLENLNNQRWNVDDEVYTDEVNKGLVTREDFLFSRYKGQTDGYVNKYLEWANVDGGYGYAQCTSYEKKEQLFSFAEAWFEEGGPGEYRHFDIADPEMQANFIVFLLESPEYADVDQLLRFSLTDAEACHVWLSRYEIPFDPYKDGYKTLSKERAAFADEIREHCAQK